ncbi:signal peptidase [Amylibacter ulvae]|uniref:Signal peptidase n=1 Tax=Paramylibacter ulvae TaxID=1651968 RepID=A0ABQ3CZM0_9RHOB|nr:imelysin family protein [Amylibacter ulvae]GHA48794.1 signal peptidase [Amylibacter ulvae]
MRKILSILLVVASPVFAGVDKGLDVTLELYQRFDDTAKSLAQSECRGDEIIENYHRAYDAWNGASIVSFGPLEQQGGALVLSFWPDKKGFTAKALSQLIADQDEAIYAPDEFASVSIAAHGFLALDMMLFDQRFNQFEQDSYSCQLVRRITQDIADKAMKMNVAWINDFAQTVRGAGEPNNTTYFTKEEAAQAYLTSLSGAFEFIETSRLARPLGTLERPRPKRAEAWRSARALPNINATITALDHMIRALGDDATPETNETMGALLRFIPTIDDPAFANITDMGTRFQVESLQTMVHSANEAMSVELGTHLGVNMGFNALDGD